MTLDLTKQLYETITTGEHPNVQLRLQPPQPGYEGIVAIPNDGSTEVVCFQEAFCEIFLECHKIIANCLGDRGGPLPRETFMATVGLLFTSYENRSALNLHERLFLEKMDSSGGTETLDREIRYVEALLTSNIGKLNKSSSLWLWYRKLVLLQREKCSSVGPRVIEVCKRSAELHFANYYCWNTLRWYYDVLEWSHEDVAPVREMVRKFAFSHLRDVSAWDALSYLYSDGGAYTSSDYTRIAQSFGLDAQLKTPLETAVQIRCEKATEVARELIRFIDTCEVCEWNAYRCLYLLLQYSNCNIAELVTQWQQELDSFERNVILVRGYPKLPQLAPGDDILEQKRQKQMMNKKRLLHMVHKAQDGE
ncbi:FAEL288Wp [Eremothecium gossypii FDAG1]|nr:FAEL288Wp [Eremothecium gossypii FDAG1]